MKADQSLENRKKLDLGMLRKNVVIQRFVCSGCGAQFYIFGLLATFENMNFLVLVFSAAWAVMKMLYGINFLYFHGHNKSKMEIFVP